MHLGYEIGANWQNISLLAGKDRCTLAAGKWRFNFGLGVGGR